MPYSIPYSGVPRGARKDTNQYRMGLRSFFFLVLFLSAAFFSADAQTITAVKEMADIQFKHGKYQEALEGYLKFQKERPKKLDVKYKIGVCYMNLEEPVKAEQYFTALLGGEPDSEVWYQMGRLKHLTGNYKDAVKYYKKYLSLTEGSGGFRKVAKHYVLQCATGMRSKYLKELAIVDNIGADVNGKFDEYAPILSPAQRDVMYFSTVRPENKGGLRDAEGFEDEILGHYTSDIYSTRLVNGSWKSTYPMDNLINSNKNDEIFGFSDNASVMFYYKGYGKENEGAIYTDTSSASQEIKFPREFKSSIKVKEGDKTPFFFNDSIIVFSSARAGGYGGHDLYVTQRTFEGYWTRPKNLGPEINTPYDEVSPFLAEDGRTLYFSSSGRESMGGFDIFSARFKEDFLKWESPVNLGAPINSPGNDLNFLMSKDGLKGFFVSDRFGGYGRKDIYAAYFKAERKEMKTKSNPVCFSLVKKKEAVADNGVNGGVSLNPVSRPVEKTQTVKISNLFYTGDEILTKTNKAELNKIIELATAYPMMKVELIGHTDDTDPENFRLYFSLLRAAAAGDYLKINGVKPKNILVKGFGSAYPIARNTTSAGEPSLVGKKLNRRIDVRLLYMENTPVRIDYVAPEVNEFIRSGTSVQYKNNQKGLSYKVQVAAQRNMYDSNIVVKYPGPMIEKEADATIMKYTVGWFRTYSSARSLMNELKLKGVNGAFVVPYIDGVRLAPTLAESYSIKYPDLLNFVRGTK